MPRRDARYESFLSTPSVRRATVFSFVISDIVLFLSTPSVRRATDPLAAQISEELFLSTPSVRRATYDGGAEECQKVFLSTPSVRRATNVRRDQLNAGIISIHALREEGDRRS